MSPAKRDRLTSVSGPSLGPAAPKAPEGPSTVAAGEHPKGRELAAAASSNRPETTDEGEHGADRKGATAGANDGGNELPGDVHGCGKAPLAGNKGANTGGDQGSGGGKGEAPAADPGLSWSSSGGSARPAALGQSTSPTFWFGHWGPVEHGLRNISASLEHLLVIRLTLLKHVASSTHDAVCCVAPTVLRVCVCV